MKKIFYGILIFAVVFASLSCNQNKNVKTEIWGSLKGKTVYLYTLINSNGNILKVTNYGGKINWIEVPDRNGKRANITFGYDTFEETRKGDMSFGATVGRYANRIAGGKFILDGIEYTTPVNNGPNTLHGGPQGWHSVVWDGEVLETTSEPSVRFTYVSPDMEAGFPGTVIAEVTYTWTDNDEIKMEYKCSTDKKTVLNITNHAYFNLHGEGNGDILDHELMIRASAFTPVDSVMIPTGEIRPVKGTPFDFTTPHVIGERIDENYDQLKLGKGYDHNFVLDNREEPDAVLYDPSSGRVLEVITDQPGLQFYSGNFLNGTKTGHKGIVYKYRSGLCLEADHFPDSPNHPDFPSTILNPGEIFRSTTVYRFSIR
jgi:aldose 1-epimerase